MYDILIIGAGGAALSSALEAKSLGAKVVVVSESYPTRAQTCMAQGGINASLANVEDDSIKLHVKDTLKASHKIADEKMIQKLCSLAPSTIEWLNAIGVPFSRLKDGKIAQRKMGGASAKRACYSQDYTGLKILHTLYDQSIKEKIEFVNEHHLLNIITDKKRAFGATFFDLRSGELKAIKAKAVIVATGGYAGIYQSFTTNSYYSSGDGVVAAYNAGAKLSNLEFVQFHPTALKGSGILISESARGGGAWLVNSEGERFVDELKPRDEVSLAIKEQLDQAKEVFLDMRHLGEEFIENFIPQERKLAIKYANVDPVSDLVPIIPAAHYSMGGILVDENFQSSIKGLFAVGEASNARVHGANRLGGNSLLEIIAFGREVVKSALSIKSELGFDESQIELDRSMIEDIYKRESKYNFYKEQDDLANRLYESVGIIRDKEGLEDALSLIEDMQQRVDMMGIEDRSKVYNTNLVEFLKFNNALVLSSLITKLALQREESRGAHKRSDFRDENLAFAKESVIQKELS